MNADTRLLHLTLHFFDKITRLMALIGLVGLTALALIIVCEVIARSFFSYAVPGVSDVSSLLTAVSIAACFGVVGAGRKHIQVNIVWNSHPRICQVLGALGNLIGVFLFGLYVWQMWEYGTVLRNSNEVTYLLQWPKGPWIQTCAILMGFCIPIHLLLLFENIINSVKTRIK